MDAEASDREFDEDKEDVLHYVDLSSAVRPRRDVKRVGVDLTPWSEQPTGQPLLLASWYLVMQESTAAADAFSSCRNAVGVTSVAGVW